MVTGIAPASTVIPLGVISMAWSMYRPKTALKGDVLHFPTMISTPFVDGDAAGGSIGEPAVTRTPSRAA